MPYKKFTKRVRGEKKWCTKNIRTGQIVCYSSPKKRETGIRMREAFAHGFKPTKRSKVIRVRPHSRKTKKRIIRIRSYKRKIKSNVAIINKRERKIFDKLTTDKDLKKSEYGGTLDFEKKKKKAFLEKFSTTLGNTEEVYFDINPDDEATWHTHPSEDWTIFSIDDMEEITKHKKQQAEVLFHKGRSVVLTKPKTLNRKKFLKEYNLTLNRVLRQNIPEKKSIGKLEKILKKYGFKIKRFKKGKQVNIELHKVN